uniref:Phosphoglycerate mutase n=1 Tax=Aquisalinus luteolus TaxID=1566827 RepID=A0A8J3A5P0_9PROT|nr:phosphoglycerate mutase [Aquisalinus luteolus]
MVGRIITARHGRPNLDRNVRITAREYGDWWARYDESGLHPDEAPPRSLIDVATNCEHVLCSTLPRAIETADHIVEGARIVPQDALFVEAPLPPPPVPWIRLRPGTWGVVSRTFWFLGYAPDETENHAQAWRRVSQIADRLIDLSAEGDVLLCAHGYLNWMIDRHMCKKRRWARVDHQGGNNYWSWRAYELEAPETRATEKPAVAE